MIPLICGIGIILLCCTYLNCVRVVVVSVLLGLSSFNARATLPVVDYSHIAQDAANEVTNLTHWVATETATVQTQLNTLQTYENTVLQVARMGDPGALKNLPVIGTIAQLAGEGQQVLKEYKQAQQIIANVQNLPQNLQSVTSAYGLQQWNPLAPQAYQFPTASYAVAQTVQQQMDTLEQQRVSLEAKRDATLQSLASATDQSSVQKYQAVLTGINGGLATISARANELAQRAALQNQQLQAGEKVMQQQTTESASTNFGGGISGEMDQLNAVAPDYTQTAHWNMQ